MRAEPNATNHYYATHVGLLMDSFERWTGRAFPLPLLPDGERGLTGVSGAAEALYRAPFVLLSHGTEADPLFNYANQTGQRLFEMTWAEFMVTPSRYSAEPLVREERLRLFERVAQHGYIDDYRGVRVSKSGRRFYIERATVWTVLDSAENLAGQAALFSSWEFL